VGAAAVTAEYLNDPSATLSGVDKVLYHYRILGRLLDGGGSRPLRWKRWRSSHFKHTGGTSIGTHLVVSQPADAP
jgi:hypothetical protein